MNLIKVLLLSVLMFSSMGSTKKHMHSAFNSMMELTPYLTDDKKFIDPDNEEKIYSYIDELSLAFKGVHNKKRFSNSHFSPSLKVLRRHVEETRIAFSAKQKYFAKNRLRATQSLCISCHTQLKTKASKNILFEMRTKAWKLNDDFQKAEVFYLLRDYPTATRSYLSYINRSLEKAKSIKKISSQGILPLSKIEQSFKRLLHLNTKVFFKPTKAIEIFRKYKRVKELPLEMRSDLDSWLSSLKKWEKDKRIQKITTISELENYYLNNISQKLESDRDPVDLLILSGRVFELMKLNRVIQDDAKALFWLGFADRQLNFSYYFSMADIYLTECIEKYPRNPVAKRCLSEYRSSVKMGYTGSAGENIPKVLQDKIKNYEQLIGN